MDSNWLEYLEALSKCCQATRHAAEYAEKCNAHAKNAAIDTKLTSFFIREALTDLKEIKAGMEVKDE